jgi:hypothetical protein
VRTKTYFGFSKKKTYFGRLKAYFMDTDQSYCNIISRDIEIMAS